MITYLFYRGVILMRLEHAGKIQSASLISAMADELVTEDWMWRKFCDGNRNPKLDIKIWRQCRRI